MTTKAKLNVESVLEEAFRAATEASLNKEKVVTSWYPCGFAWVTVKPAHCKTAKKIVEMGWGRKSYEGGVMVWNPSRHITQNIDIKYAGAIAFAEVLNSYGIKAVADCRMD